jgi:hypothetical protein
MNDNEFCGFTFVVPERLIAEIMREDEDDKPIAPATADEARRQREVNRRIDF